MADMTWTVRFATLDDVDAVLALDRLSPVGHTRELLLTARAQTGEILIAVLNERVVGYIVLHARAFFGRDFVDLLVIDPRYRRQGIGNELLHQAIEHSSTNRIFTSTNESNTPMVELLNRDGWEFSGRLEGMDEGDPEVVFFTDAKQVSD